jgi:hypothetical protein
MFGVTKNVKRNFRSEQRRPLDLQTSRTDEMGTSKVATNNEVAETGHARLPLDSTVISCVRK